MKKYVDGEYIEMTQSEIDAIKIANQKALLEDKSIELSIEDKLLIIANSINVQIPSEAVDNNLPYKVGYKWEAIYSDGSIIWRSVADPDAIGTAENPIIYTDDVKLIDNAYYLRDGVRYVYMSGEWVEF